MLEIRPETNADIPGHPANKHRGKKFNESLEDVAPRSSACGNQNAKMPPATLAASRDLRLKKELKIVQDVHIVGSGVLTAAIEVFVRIVSCHFDIQWDI